MTTCCSTRCEKRYECNKHCFNNVGSYTSEDFYTFGTGSISSEGCKEEHWCGELGNYKMFEPIKKQTDYQQWRDWFDKWNVEYEEEIWNSEHKELIVGGSYCQASVVFDLEDNFICVTAYE